MYPAAFDYHVPTTLDEALELLRDLGPAGAKLLAGGASLVPLMKLRLVEPAHLVDLNRVPGLADVAAAPGGGLDIGAMTREADLGASPAGQIGVLADACRVIADPLVRAVGTVGGNVAHGDPANDHPAIMLALGARVVVRSSARGTREVASADFHVDLLQTALEPDEIVTAIRIPATALGPRTGSAYVKFERQVGDYAIAAAAAVVTLDSDRRRIERATVTFTNLAPVPRRSARIEAELVGSPADPMSAAAAAAALADDELEPWDDLRATAAVKRTMARAAAARAITSALRRAREGTA